MEEIYEENDYSNCGVSSNCSHYDYIRVYAGRKILTMEKKKEFLINVLYILIIAALGFLIVKYLVPVLFPFIIAFLIGIVLRKPIIKVSALLHIKEKWAAVLMTVLFYILVVVGMIFVGSKLCSLGIENLPKLPALYNEKIQPWMDHYMENVENNSNGILTTIIPMIQSSLENLSTNIGELMSEYSGKVTNYISGFATAIPAIVVRAVITVVATFFITIDYNNIQCGIKKILPEKIYSGTERVYQQAITVIKVYLKSYSLLMLLTFVELSIGLCILRVAHPILLAVLIAVFDILPVLGTGGILIPWAIIALLIHKYSLGIGILILYLVITILRNILEPKIVGRQIGLHPLVTLISLFVGMKLFGVIGLIGLPVALSIGVSLYQKEK